MRFAAIQPRTEEDEQMAIFKVGIAGRKSPVLIKAEGKREAYARIITSCDALTAEEMEVALTSGDKVWAAGEPFPVEAPEVKGVDDGLIKDGMIDPVGEMRKAGEGLPE
jgi:hypothetical protein